jgi:hypothetical protein
MKPDLHAMLDSFRTIDEEAGEAAYYGPMIDAFLKLSPKDQVEFLAYFVFALMDRWEAEEETDRRGRKAIQDMLDLNDMVQAGRGPRQ